MSQLQQYCLENMGQRRVGKKEKNDSKRSYARISLKRRKMLINMVFKEGYSIARTIKKLSLKLTTARFILQKYKESGTFPMKQFKRNARMLKDLPEQSPSQASVAVKVEDEQAEQVVKLESQQPIHNEEALEGLQMTPFIYYYYFPCVYPQ